MHIVCLVAFASRGATAVLKYLQIPCERVAGIAASDVNFISVGQKVSAIERSLYSDFTVYVYYTYFQPVKLPRTTWS